MKKILFCSLMLCCGFVANSGFAGSNLAVIVGGADGASCRKTPNGEIECAYHETGGPTEKDKCMRRSDFVKNTIWSDPDGKDLCRCYLDDYVKWAPDGTACSPTGAPANSGVCRWFPENGTKKITYKQRNMHSEPGDDNPCRYEVSDICGNSNLDILTIEEKITSCAAKECSPGWLLYTSSKKKSANLPVTGNVRAKKAASQGLCREKTWLQKNVCDKGCGCGEHEKCIVNEVTVKNYGKDVPAYVGEEACYCAPDGSVVVEETCKYTFTATVTCYTNGQTTTYNGRDFEVPKSAFKDGVCVDTNVEQQFSDWYSQQRTEVQQWFDANCPQQPVDNNNVPNIELQNATSKVDSFIASVRSSKRDVWKDAEGKFNTARLASDLTAGIVLGTVGGVVSGVVIKKKQVEKGFDALHCTVGGQKVADWGDEFSVGLQR